MNELYWAHIVAEESKYLSHREVSLIQVLAPSLPPRAVCVNLGCGPGTSIVALLEVRRDLEVYSIDYLSTKKLDQFKRSGVSERVIEIVDSSHNVVWDNGLIDWLFIDTEHRLEEITKEIQHWLPYARGQVLFHDYNDTMGAKHWNGVQEAVNAWAGERKPLAMADSLIVFDLHE